MAKKKIKKIPQIPRQIETQNSRGCMYRGYRLGVENEIQDNLITIDNFRNSQLLNIGYKQSRLKNITKHKQVKYSLIKH